MVEDSGRRVARARYTVDLPGQLDRRISAIALDQGITKSEVLRNALSLLAEYVELQREGYSTGAWREKDDGSRDTVRIIV